MEDTMNTMDEEYIRNLNVDDAYINNENFLKRSGPCYIPSNCDVDENGNIDPDDIYDYDKLVDVVKSYEDMIRPYADVSDPDTLECVVDELYEMCEWAFPETIIVDYYNYGENKN